MTTHPAVVTVAARAPLQVHQVPTPTPAGDEVQVLNEWTASTPLDLHQADGGLLVNHPQILGDGTAGTVVAAGPDAKRLKVGDKIFGFTWQKLAHKSHQKFVTVPENLLGVLPQGFELPEAVTLGNNFVTVFHALTADLGLELPWPKPEGYVPKGKHEAILVWGGSSSVGMFAIQVLRYYGYEKVFTTASKKNHALLKGYGASDVFDYGESDVVEKILKAAGGGAKIPLIFDCIGSKAGSVAPISRIAEKKCRMAVLLPIIVKDASETVTPEYMMDVGAAAEWADGVEARGVRTHFYLDVSLPSCNTYPLLHTSVLAP